MLYVGQGRDEVSIASEGTGSAMLLGGVPFDERIVMWWNFAGRSHDEVAEARAEWERDRTSPDEGSRFGVVRGYAEPALPAPELPNVALRARGRTRHGS